MGSETTSSPHLRLIGDTPVDGAYFQRQVTQMALHRIGDHPQCHDEAIEQQQGADERNQLRILEHLVLAHRSTTAVGEYPVDAVRLCEHGAKRQGEASGQEVDTCLWRKRKGRKS